MTASASESAAFFSVARRSRIVLAHGGGGQMMDELLDEFIKPRLTNEFLSSWDDGAILPGDVNDLVMTTDSFVVQPLEFPGGDIGRLAISGTVNDVAVSGGIPKYISLGLILEEGLELETLGRILDSIAQTAREANVQVVTGDTKVVARGEADGMYINTTGLGPRRAGIELGMQHVRPGDALIISGTIADHGMAVMLQREAADSIQSDLKSDAAPLGGLIDHVLDSFSQEVVFMRDPTRSGVAGVVAEIATRTGHRLMIDEAALPIRQETLYALEMLGLDPLNVANEGKVVFVVRPEAAEPILARLREHPLGHEAAVIGTVGDEQDGLCEMLTHVGGRRIIQKPYGEELPRIC